MKGIVMAGGAGTRLNPITMAVSKQLLLVYDKPLIYYPISVLMLAGIRDILLITTPDNLMLFQRLLGNGERFGINLSYAVQTSPDGVAQAFLIADKFIGSDDVCLVLGDNLFYGQGFSPVLKRAANHKEGATIFCYSVLDPERFGVVELDADMQPVTIEEKPTHPKSRYAVTGLYFYDNSVVDITRNIKPSARNELEISDVNIAYMRKGKLRVEILGRGFAWLDTGTFDSLLDAAHFVETVESRQGYKIACLEEIAWRNDWLSTKDILARSEALGKSKYAEYLRAVVVEVGRK